MDKRVRRVAWSGLAGGRGWWVCGVIGVGLSYTCAVIQDYRIEVRDGLSRLHLHRKM